MESREERTKTQDSEGNGEGTGAKKDGAKTPVGGKIVLALMILITSPIILPCVIFFGCMYAISSPFERRKYKKSAYYRDLKIGYNWEITSWLDYRIYNETQKEGLPLERKEFSDGSAWYLWKRERETIALLMPPFEEIFRDKKTGAWQAGDTEREAKELKEALKEIYGKNFGELQYPVKLVIEDVFNRKDRAAAETETAFVLLSGRPLAEVLERALPGGLVFESESE